MKTLTKTKLTVKTAVGIALIGGAALVAGGFGFRIYQSYNPVIQPVVQNPQNQVVTAEPVVNGNIAGKNVKDADARCEKQAYDYISSKNFLTYNQPSYGGANPPVKNASYPTTDFACFSKSSAGDAYIGGAQSSAGQKYATPQGVTNTAYNQNGDNNYCCDIKKYYSAAEVANCRWFTEDSLGRPRGKDELALGNKFVCMDTNFEKGNWVFGGMDREKFISKDICKKEPQLGWGFTAGCPIGVESCGFWGMTNNRGRAGFDLCANKQYSKVCINPSGEYVGCQKQGSSKCVNIDIYNNTITTINQPSSAIVCNTGEKDWTGKSCQVWVNDINNMAGKAANIAKQNCAEAGYSRVCVDKFTGAAKGCATKGSSQCYNFNTGGAVLGANFAMDANLDACATGVADKQMTDSFCDPLFKKQSYLAKAQACISRSTGSEEFYGLCLNKSLGGTVYNAGENGCLSALNSESCVAAGGYTCWLKDFASGEWKYGLTGKTQ